MMTIEEIREELSDRNLAEVGRRLNITRSYLSSIVNRGRVPSYFTVSKLSNYLTNNKTELEVDADDV